MIPERVIPRQHQCNWYCRPETGVHFGLWWTDYDVHDWAEMTGWPGSAVGWFQHLVKPEIRILSVERTDLYPGEILEDGSRLDNVYLVSWKVPDGPPTPTGCDQEQR